MVSAGAFLSEGIGVSFQGLAVMSPGCMLEGEACSLPVTFQWLMQSQPVRWG